MIRMAYISNKINIIQQCMVNKQSQTRQEAVKRLRERSLIGNTSMLRNVKDGLGLGWILCLYRVQWLSDFSKHGNGPSSFIKDRIY